MTAAMTKETLVQNITTKGTEIPTKDEKLTKVAKACGEEVNDNGDVIITDPVKNLNARIKLIQGLLAASKDRNNTDKDKVKKELKNAINAYILAVSACINHNLVDEDKTGILRGEALNKYFPKATGHVNKIAKECLAEQSKVSAHKGAKLSESQLAKLIETPFEYHPKDAVEDTANYNENGIAQVDSAPAVNDETVIDLECVDGSKVTVDKEDGSMYVETETESGETITFKRKVAVMGLTWFETAKNIASAFLGVVFSYLGNIAMYGVNLVTGTIATITGSTVRLGSETIQDSKTFFGNLKTSLARGRESAMANGIFL